MIEVELKFRINDARSLASQILTMGGIEEGIEKHEDLYFRHPCRDFVVTKEALRIRRVEVLKPNAFGQLQVSGEARVTYKGPHLPGVIKARKELEWLLNPSDPSGDNLHDLLMLLGFTPVATVIKSRQLFRVNANDVDVILSIDDVQGVGSFVEVEVIAETQSDVEHARSTVATIARNLGLGDATPRSYLSMLLDNAIPE